jgi:hypothetical protein
MTGAVSRPSSLLLAAGICLALAALTLLLPSGVTYDPYAWLIWGRDLAHLDLVTRGGGTSWKPLPALVAALLSPLGRAQGQGWLVVARAGALFATFMVFRLARRASPGWAGWVAGFAAGATFALTHEVVKRIGVGNAEGLTAALGLLAVDRHLMGRRGQAFACGVAAALTRPEAWLLLIVYTAWLWRAHAGPPRRFLAAGFALVPLLWFGGDWLGSGRLSTGSDRALHRLAGTPGASAHPGLAVFQEAWRMLPLPGRVALPVGALVLLAGCLRDRRPTAGRAAVAALACGALVWTLVVAAMAQRGYPGLPRFLFPALAGAAVVAGTGAARIAELAVACWRRLPRPLAGAAVPVVLAAVVLAFAAAAVPDAARLKTDAAAVDAVADRDSGLADAVRRVGGPEGVLDCGRPYTGWFAVTALAWDLGVQTDHVHVAPHGRRPVVFVLDHGHSGLGAPLPRRHVRVVRTPGPWSVVDRCGGVIRNAARQAHAPSAHAGSRSPA